MRSAKDINLQFRQQIRNRRTYPSITEKQQMFKQIRQQFNSNIQSNPIQLTKLLNSNKCINPSAALNKIASQIHPSKSDSLLTSIKLNDNALHIYLMNNFQKGVYLEETLLVCVHLLSHQKLKASYRFVNRGILEYLLVIPNEHPYLIKLSMNLLGIIVLENSDNADTLLINYSHRTLFTLYEDHVLNKPINFIQENSEIGWSISWALMTLLEVEDAQSYQEQFEQILRFATSHPILFELYPFFIIQTIYLVGYSFREKTKQIGFDCLARYISEVSPQAKYLKSLLITIKLLSPMKGFPIQHISCLVALIPNYLISYCLSIFINCVDEQSRNQLPLNNQIWWLKLLSNCIRQQNKQNYIKLLLKCQVNKQWVFPIINQVLQQDHILVITECFNYLQFLLNNNPNAHYFCQSNSITLSVQKYLEHKNHIIERRAQEILLMISQSRQKQKHNSEMI